MFQNIFIKVMTIGIIVVFVGASVLPVLALDLKASKNSKISSKINIGLNKEFNTDYIQLVFSSPQIINEGRFQRVTIKEIDKYNLVSGEPIIPVYNTVMKYPLGTEIVDVKCTFDSIGTMCLSKKITPAPSTVKPDIKTKNIQQKFY